MDGVFRRMWKMPSEAETTMRPSPDPPDNLITNQTLYLDLFIGVKTVRTLHRCLLTYLILQITSIVPKMLLVTMNRLVSGSGQSLDYRRIGAYLLMSS